MYRGFKNIQICWVHNMYTTAKMMNKNGDTFLMRQTHEGQK